MNLTRMLCNTYPDGDLSAVGHEDALDWPDLGGRAVTSEAAPEVEEEPRPPRGRHAQHRGHIALLLACRSLVTHLSAKMGRLSGSDDRRRRRHLSQCLPILILRQVRKTLADVGYFTFLQN